MLVIAGAEDSLVSMKYCQAMASKFVNSVSIHAWQQGGVLRRSDFFFPVSILIFNFSWAFDVQRLVAISGCGHLPHEECPKALLEAISPFINKLFFSVYKSQSKQVIPFQVYTQVNQSMIVGRSVFPPPLILFLGFLFPFFLNKNITSKRKRSKASSFFSWVFLMSLQVF